MGILKTKTSTYGNGLALPIPKKILELYGEVGTMFDIQLNIEEGKILLTKEDDGGKKNE